MTQHEKTHLHQRFTECPRQTLLAKKTEKGPLDDLEQDG